MTTKEIMELQVRGAIESPENFVGAQREDESYSEWATRAVLTILAVEFGGVLPHVDEPPYSDTWVNHSQGTYQDGIYKA